MTPFDQQILDLLGIKTTTTADMSGARLQPCGPDCECVVKADDGATRQDAQDAIDRKIASAMFSAILSELGADAGDDEPDEPDEAPQSVEETARFSVGHEDKVEAVAALSCTMASLSEASLILARLMERVVINPED